MLNAAEGFRAVAHRLELVHESNGVRWYDDSIGTAPERVVAAVQAFDEPLVLLLGGRDKDLPWQDLARLVCQRVDHVVLFGEAAGKIQEALTSAGAKPAKSDGRPYSVEVVAHMRDAVERARLVAEPGDVVLLSPGGTSFDEFKDFEERGERFKRWVRGLS
jgi:UDP-N-acetylmuramoylalanine--D-glutamate ligase